MTDDPKTRDRASAGGYEKPEIEEIDTEAAPAVTAAGTTPTDTTTQIG